MPLAVVWALLVKYVLRERCRHRYASWWMSVGRLVLIAGLGAAGLVAGGLAAHPTLAQRLPVTSYGVDHGIPPAPVTAIVEDPGGRIWVGTDVAGLRRLDGAPQATALMTSDGLPSNTVRALAIGPDGAVWAGTDGGLAMLSPGADGPRSLGPKQPVVAVAAASKGGAWFATAHRLWHTDGNVTDTVAVLVQDSVTALHRTSAGATWVGTTRGLMRLEGGALKPDSSFVSPATVHALTQRSGGPLWLATSRGLARREADGTLTWWYRGTPVHSVYVDRQGTTWAGTATQGVLRVDAGAVTRIARASGLCGDGIHAIAQDRYGGLWFGTDGSGICRLDPTALRFFRPPPGTSRRIAAIARPAAGTLWLARDEQLFGYPDGRLTRVPAQRWRLPATVNALAPALGGDTLWIGTTNGTLYRHTDAHLDSIAGGLFPILALTTAPDGTLWVGTLRGAGPLRDGRVHIHPATRDHPVWDIAVDPGGRVWMAGGIAGGGVLLRPGAARTDSLPDAVQTFPATAVTIDTTGAVWWGSNQGRGLLRYRPSHDSPAHLTSLYADDGLLRNSVRFLALGPRGRVWAGHEQGLSRLDSSPTADSVVSRVFPSATLAAGAVRRGAAAVDTTGRLWVGTDQGVVAYATAWDHWTPTAPPIEIVHLRTNGFQSRLDGSDSAGISKVRLDPANEQITVTLRSSGITGARGVRYQYRLRGLSGAWSPLQANNTIRVNSLPPGDYELAVRAVTAQGVVSRRPATVQLTVVPAWWERPWLWGGLAMALVLGTLGIVRYRSMQAQRRQRHLEGLVQARTAALKSKTERLKEANAQLEMLSLVASSTDNIVYIAAPDGTLQWVNAAFEQATGYTLNDLRIQNMGTVQAISTRDDIDALVTACLDERRAVSYESSLHTRDGEQRYYSSTLSYSTCADGTPDKLVVIDTDISDRVALEQELIEAREAAVSASRAKSAFLATMSHEIRTPLNGVIGMASLLEHTPLSDEQQEHVDIIQSSAHALLSLISDILDFSKIEAERLDLDPVPVRLHEVVEDALAPVRRAAAQKGLELAGVIEHTAPEAVELDPKRLRQVLTNLLANAVKFTDAGHVAVYVQAEPTALLDRASHQAEHLLTPAPDVPAYRLSFAVEDTGIGIPAEEQKAIFEAFTQADGSDTREYGGTGLGLAISRRLVEAMGGTLTVGSVAGEGSTFRFTLPVRVAEPPPPLEPKVIAERLRDRHALVVDDNPVNRRMMEELLRRWALRVTTVSTPSEALAQVAKARYDLGVLDMQMPEMDGLALARRIEARAAYNGFPLVIMSSIEQRHAADTAPVADWLTKPVRVRPLRRTLARVLTPAGPALPLKTPSRSAGTPPADASETAPSVLLVEDNPINRKVGLRLLAQLDYAADAVTDGEAALRALDEGSYTAILMDIQMPGIDGLETTRRIRAHHGHAHHIIALTANALNGDRERCLDAGMDDYLTKPVQPDKLRDALSAVG